MYSGPFWWTSFRWGFMSTGFPTKIPESQIFGAVRLVVQTWCNLRPASIADASRSSRKDSWACLKEGHFESRGFCYNRKNRHELTTVPILKSNGLCVNTSRPLQMATEKHASILPPLPEQFMPKCKGCPSWFSVELFHKVALIQASSG